MLLDAQQPVEAFDRCDFDLDLCRTELEIDLFVLDDRLFPDDDLDTDADFDDGGRDRRLIFFILDGYC